MANYLLWARRNRLAINPVGTEGSYVAPNVVRIILDTYSPIGESPQQLTQVVLSSPPLTNSSIALPLPIAPLGTSSVFAGAFIRKLPDPTITIASPAVVTCTSHGLLAGLRVLFNTSGTLPTGIVSGAFYFIINATTNTFNLAPNIGGSPISTSGVQSGTHTLWYQT